MARIVSADARSPESAEIGSPPTPSANVRSPITTSGEGHVLGLEDFVMIQVLVKRGVYLSDIAEQLGVHPKTVRRALDRGGPPARGRRRRGSRLDPY
jgi:hypothetical protein